MFELKNSAIIYTIYVKELIILKVLKVYVDKK
jgi:hypothetical protein